MNDYQTFAKHWQFKELDFYINTPSKYMYVKMWPFKDYERFYKDVHVCKLFLDFSEILYRTCK